MADKKISQLTAATVPLAGTEVLPIVQSSTTVKVSVADVTKGRTIQTTGINDNNNNEVITITTTASAVNEITVANAATGANPVISATGSDTNIGITLTPKGTGNLVLTSGNLAVANGNGIDFSATSGTGSSELFDDYEEGTFTPTIVGSVTPGTGTYSAQQGFYTKIGRQVTVYGRVAITNHTGSGNMSIGGLPYALDGSNNWYATGSIVGTNLAVNANSYPIIFMAGSSSTEIIIEQVATQTGTNASVTLDTACDLLFSITYFVAS